MKLHIRQFVLPLLLSILNTPARAASPNEKIPPDYDPFVMDALFRVPNSYSHTLGWSLLPNPTGRVRLYEAHQVSTLLWDDYSPRGANFNNGKPTLNNMTKEELDKIRLGTTLAIGELKDPDDPASFVWDRDASAVLARLRDSFQLYNDASSGLDFNYRSFDGDDELTLKGALMVDVYPRFMYANGVQVPGFQETHRFWVRTGVEADRNEASDRTSIYLLLAGQANPELKASLFNDAVRITSPQIIQAGIALDDDQETGEQDMRFILAWQPALYLQDGFTLWDWIRGKSKNHDSAGAAAGGSAVSERTFGSGFGINHRMYFRKLNAGGPAWLHAPFAGDEPEARSTMYTFIPANLELDSSSDLLKKALDDGSFGGATLDWNIGLGVGSDRVPLRATYLCEGKSPISDLGESRVAHSLSLSWTVGLTAMDKVDDDNNPVSGDEVFSGLTFVAKYITGEFDDHPGNHDEFTIGTNLRF